MTSKYHRKNRRILIIDDNESIHADFRKILSPPPTKESTLSLTETQLFGNPLDPTEVRPVRFELDSAYQGEQGMELVKQALQENRPYAMAFVDMRMPPGWDGLITSQKIFEIDSRIQVIICTAYSDYSWNEIFDRIGADDRLFILKKPFETTEALQLAQDLAQKWNLKCNPKP